MKSAEVRQKFLEYFKEKEHQIVPSAPMVIKNDPTLMFTNAGMNQFKDIFLGNAPAKNPRIADTQKCLRVSGKHNDLEEVGLDTYHHTMFEMLGNWSFGDYFKKEAINWAWELLTGVLKIDKDRLYASVFGGDEQDGTAVDKEAYDNWRNILPEERILYGSRKDNFWEMGDTGPCGPCSEIHIDIRDDKERAKLPGSELVNKDHPEVIEIWNLVFIEFNRTADSKLHPLPSRHVDTGMGFERLCLVLQGVKSNYDTDIFQPIIQKIATISGIRYGSEQMPDIAMRVVADHLRAVSFAIADGQLPSNTGAGYVIRRILRRATRYAYTFLDLKEPFIHELLPVLVRDLGAVFPELLKQETLIAKVIREEEASFLRTLAQGIKKFDNYIKSHQEENIIDGEFAFELFDTYGFPIDLTQLMAREIERAVDMEGFNAGLLAQKNRSKKAAAKDTEDWIEVKSMDGLTEFLGYDQLSSEVNIIKYRKVKSKNKDFYELVLDKTPFYPESGGQVGDTGLLIFGEEKIPVTDTKKENDLIIHVVSGFIEDPSIKALAEVNSNKRTNTINNHTATHLMHRALRQVLGDHVEQKGSLVDDKHLRFDFSHYQKLTDDELRKVENIVNQDIRLNLARDEKRSIPMDEALEMGAMAFFGEKYGEEVRVIKFGDSIELCGGTHVPQTGHIGIFKIISEGGQAAGIRRIEAITGAKAEEFMQDQSLTIASIKDIIKQKDLAKGVESLFRENDQLQKQVKKLTKDNAKHLENQLSENVEDINGVHFLAIKLEEDNALIKDLVFSMTGADSKLFILVGSHQGDKTFLSLAIGKELIDSKGLNAGSLIRDLAKEINGGGGGQAHFATAGGSNPRGLESAFVNARKFVEELLLKN